MGRHRHAWSVTRAVRGVHCVIVCSCGARVRVLRTGRGLRPEVLNDCYGFTVEDGHAVVLLAVGVLGSP
jgi:metal-dependent HD superfamily phosphatase/phosphodiesterase